MKKSTLSFETFLQTVLDRKNKTQQKHVKSQILTSATDLADFKTINYKDYRFFPCITTKPD